MQRVRPKAKLVADLMTFAHTPCEGKGGWQYQIRAAQRLALEAALELGRWGRVPEARSRQPADLFHTALHSTAQHPTTHHNTPPEL